MKKLKGFIYAVLLTSIGVFGLAACSLVPNKPQPAVTVTAPAPTVTVTAPPEPTKTVTEKAKPAPTVTVTAKPKKTTESVPQQSSERTADKIAAENANCDWTEDDNIYTSSWCRGIIVDVPDGMDPTVVAYELAAELDETDGDYYVVGKDYIYYTPDHSDAKYVKSNYGGTIYTDDI